MKVRLNGQKTWNCRQVFYHLMMILYRQYSTIDSIFVDWVKCFCVPLKYVKQFNDLFCLVSSGFRGDSCLKQTWTYYVRPERDDLEVEGKYHGVMMVTVTQNTYKHWHTHTHTYLPTTCHSGGKMGKSPKSEIWVQSQQSAQTWAQLYLGGIAWPPAPAPSFSWCPMYQEPVSTAKVQSTRASVPACHLTGTAPGPQLSYCRWWTHWRATLCHLFDLSQTEPRVQVTRLQAALS